MMKKTKNLKIKKEALLSCWSASTIFLILYQGYNYSNLKDLEEDFKNDIDQD